MENCGDFPIFWQAFVNKLQMMKRKKKEQKTDIFVAGLLKG